MPSKKTILTIFAVFVSVLFLGAVVGQTGFIVYDDLKREVNVVDYLDYEDGMITLVLNTDNCTAPTIIANLSANGSVINTVTLQDASSLEGYTTPRDNVYAAQINPNTRGLPKGIITLAAACNGYTYAYDFKIAPTPPQFFDYNFPAEKPIAGDNITFSINLSDKSGIAEGSPLVHISVPETCAPLTMADVPLVKKSGKYYVENYNLERACTYTLNFKAKDTRGLIGNYTPANIVVAELLANNLTALKTNLFILTDDLKCAWDSGATRFGAGYSYTFTLDSTAPVGYGVKFTTSFLNKTDRKKLILEEFSESVNASLAYISSISDDKRFALKLTPDTDRTVCFTTAKKDSRHTILLCGKEDINSCEKDDWHMVNIDSEGCANIKKATAANYFVLATCHVDYWKDGCKTSKVGTDTANDPSKSTKGGIPVSKAKSTDGDVTNLTLTNTTGNETASGGLLAGFGAFFTDNKGAAIPVGIGIVLGLALLTFIAFRKKGINLSLKGKKRDAPSIHELAKKHDMQKPTDPKDEKKLHDFAEVALMMGHNLTDLSDALKYRGWDPNSVDNVFKPFKGADNETSKKK